MTKTEQHTVRIVRMALPEAIEHSLLYNLLCLLYRPETHCSSPFTVGAPSSQVFRWPCRYELLFQTEVN